MILVVEVVVMVGSMPVAMMKVMKMLMVVMARAKLIAVMM